MTQATVHHAWRNVLEGLQGHKPSLPVAQQQSVEEAIQQAVETAHHVAGLSEVDETDIRELITPIKEDTQEMLQELDDVPVQQPVIEQVETTGEPSTGDLWEIVELFDRFAHKLYNADPNNARAYATLTSQTSPSQ